MTRFPTYVSEDGNWGTAPVVVLDLTTDELIFVEGLPEYERYKTLKIMQENRDQPDYDVWSAHAALMSEQDENTWPWVIVDGDGGVLDRFQTEQERDEDLATGEWPDDAEPAYIN